LIDVRSQSDEAEEIHTTAMFNAEELQAITCVNQICKVPLTKPDGGSISGAGYQEEDQQTSFTLCNNPTLVPIRCLKISSMACNGNTQAGVGARGEQAPGGRDDSFRRRAGKEKAGSSSNVKSILVVNMSGERQAMRARFLAVGLFLSVLLANSQQVIEHMKKVWKIRGHMEANPLDAEEGQRKFILEFSEDGDRDHVVCGGPWQYKGDAFLVEGLAVGADPVTALFTHMPMWVQFRNIPFHLLTKKLARDLGEQVGSLVKIDNNSRGNICDKFLRA
jgi:hypothetical protein